MLHLQTTVYETGRHKVDSVVACDVVVVTISARSARWITIAPRRNVLSAEKIPMDVLIKRLISSHEYRKCSRRMSRGQHPKMRRKSIRMMSEVSLNCLLL